MQQIIIALILSLAAEAGLPPNFVLAVAYAENWKGSIEASDFKPERTSPPNYNGTRDLGIMQLNSRYYGNIKWWDAKTNIRAAITLILWLEARCYTYWDVALTYNCGYSRRNNPPAQSINFANLVMTIWTELENTNYINPIIKQNFN